jgi:vacuolar-type H+-ATPase subunit H
MFDIRAEIFLRRMDIMKPMVEKRIQQVLEIERQAQSLYDSAVRQSQQLPAAAKREARDHLEQTVAAAREKAQRMQAEATAETECASIAAQSEQAIQRMETSAKERSERAVDYVLDAVAGGGKP